MRGVERLFHIQSGLYFQTAGLFLLDGLANLTDFGFHFWMGRVLVPADFATLQTLNSVILVYATASGVFQPVVGRFIAEARGKDLEEAIPGISQLFFQAAFWLGLVLSLLVLFFSNIIAQLLNLPSWAIQICATLIFLSTLRPVAMGALQGQERFVPFGLSRFFTSFGRLLFAIILFSYGLSLKGVILAFPLGWLTGIAIALVFLRGFVWRKNAPASRDLLREGWKLSIYALLAYFAFMSLMSIDLIWVNRNLSSEAAGGYAGLVLLRRVVALLPGAAVVVVFPRITKALAEGQLPDRLILHTAAVILLTGGVLTALFFIFGRQIVSMLFGNAYLAVAPLLGWMGLAMTGLSLSSIWLNFYLAHKPRNFVFLLILAVILEMLFLYLMQPSVQSGVIAFGITGWLLAASGLALYHFKHRKELKHA